MDERLTFVARRLDGEKMAALCREFESMGVRHLPVWLWPNSTAGVEAFAPVLEALES